MLRDCGGFGIDSKDPFKNFDRNFNIMQTVVVSFIVLVFILVISIWSIAAFGIFKGAKEVKQRGLKHVIEEVWNGQDAK